MKKIFCILFLVTVSCATISAQNYNWGIGVRGAADFAGLNAKFNLSPKNSVEATLGFVDGVNLVGLYEWNIPVIAEGFNFYYGVGANIGSWDDEFTMGIDAVVGLEFKPRQIPFAFAIDYIPTINFAGKTGFRAYDFGLSIRYTF